MELLSEKQIGAASDYPIHTLANLMPPMSEDEYSLLRSSIEAEGLHTSIVLYEDQVLDGRHRLKACQELGVEVHTVTYIGDSPVQYVWDTNTTQRVMNSGQKAAVALGFLTEFEKEAEKRMLAGVAVDPCQKFGKGSRSDSKAATIAGTNKTYVSYAKKLFNDHPEEYKSLKMGEQTIQQIKRKFKEEKRAAKALTRVKSLDFKASDEYELFHISIENACSVIEPESVDWIITDPPYPKEYLPVYDHLSTFAQYALRPGGSLLVMVGQSYLPSIIESLETDVKYHWCCAYLTPGGQAPHLFARKVNTFWKPLLWFTKGKYKGDTIGDVCKSDVNDNDKMHHHWGQSVSGMADIVNRFTHANDTVCDPFLGGGTTAIASLSLGRKFIGMDACADEITKTERRLQDV